LRKGENMTKKIWGLIAVGVLATVALGGKPQKADNWTLASAPMPQSATSPSVKAGTAFKDYLPPTPPVKEPSFKTAADNGEGLLVQIITLCEKRAKASPFNDGWLRRVVLEDCCKKRLLGMSEPSVCAKYQ
jgi:hypothetical protein